MSSHETNETNNCMAYFFLELKIGLASRIMLFEEFLSI